MSMEERDYKKMKEIIVRGIRRIREAIVNAQQILKKIKEDDIILDDILFEKRVTILQNLLVFIDNEVIDLGIKVSLEVIREDKEVEEIVREILTLNNIAET
jgi:hypothetical protein